jgi:hypothetical protein
MVSPGVTPSPVARRRRRRRVEVEPSAESSSPDSSLESSSVFSVFTPSTEPGLRRPRPPRRRRRLRLPRSSESPAALSVAAGFSSTSAVSFFAATFLRGLFSEISF